MTSRTAGLSSTTRIVSPCAEEASDSLVTTSAQGASSERGSRMWNVLPAPTLLSAQIWPPARLTMP